MALFFLVHDLINEFHQNVCSDVSMNLYFIEMDVAIILVTALHKITQWIPMAGATSKF